MPFNHSRFLSLFPKGQLPAVRFVVQISESVRVLGVKKKKRQWEIIRKLRIPGEECLIKVWKVARQGSRLC